MRVDDFKPTLAHEADPPRWMPDAGYQWHAFLADALAGRIPLDEDYCPLTEMLDIYETLVVATSNEGNGDPSDLVLYEDSVQPGLDSFSAHLDGIEGVADGDSAVAASEAYREGMVKLREAAEHLRVALVAEARWAEQL